MSLAIKIKVYILVWKLIHMHCKHLNTKIIMIKKTGAQKKQIVALTCRQSMSIYPTFYSTGSVYR